MDEERYWNRVTEVVRKIATEERVPVPPAFEQVSGDVWSRDAQRRAALAEFSEQVAVFPVIPGDMPVDQIADVLDVFYLEQQQSEEESA